MYSNDGKNHAERNKVDNIDFGNSLITDFEYVSTPLMVTRRGDYVAAHAYDDDQYLIGSYIDLFDSNLSVLDDPDVPRDDSVILYDIEGIKRDIPRLGYTSGQVLDLVESAGKTTIRLTSAANVNVGIRMLLPKNTYPSSVTVTDADGKKVRLSDYFGNRFSLNATDKPVYTVRLNKGQKMSDLAAELTAAL